jgi:tetratricopeptide (TPR) repeat protein
MATKLARVRIICRRLLLEAEIALAQGTLMKPCARPMCRRDTPRTEAGKNVRFSGGSVFKREGKREGDKIARSLDTASLNAEGLLSLINIIWEQDMTPRHRLCQAGLSRYPNSAEVNYHYGQYLFKKGRYEEAGLSYKKALTVAPSVQIIAYQYIQCLFATNRLGEVKAYLDDMDRKYPTSLLTLGAKLQYHLLVDERRQAIDTLNRITRLIPYAPRPYTIPGQSVLAGRDHFRSRKKKMPGRQWP